MNVFYKAGVTALAVCFNLPVMAQAQPTAQGASQPPSPASLPARDMEHVLVTVPMHRTDAETALPITVLSDSKLRNSLAATIGETLASKPGLASASFGPSVGQPVIRGQQGARVTVLQNSTSSADASNISADHSVSVEPVLAQSIEVLRGPSTLLYGGGAIGGVVNVIDNRVPVTVPKNLSGAFEVRHASVNDEATAVVSVNGGGGDFFFFFHLPNSGNKKIKEQGGGGA